jgi:hypothetical protein
MSTGAAKRAALQTARRHAPTCTASAKRGAASARIWHTPSWMALLSSLGDEPYDGPSPPSRVASSHGSDLGGLHQVVSVDRMRLPHLGLGERLVHKSVHK